MANASLFEVQDYTHKLHSLQIVTIEIIWNVFVKFNGFYVWLCWLNDWSGEYLFVVNYLCIKVYAILFKASEMDV